ncbi:MAG: hypothetical protein U9O94_07160, partial [Nanoarchaeota archaeon]|nr:hypothetical protein [Nanoarchaeota archaeon]
MSHINYFEPYTSRSSCHEDQLTRAFLVVLRYVPSALMMFYDSVVSTINKKASETKQNIELPSISEIDLSNLDFKTQTQKIEDVFNTSKIVSVLITDETFDSLGSVSSSDRGARYDGVIYFSSDVALIIENKPNSCDVWGEQLSPSAQSLPEGVEIVPIASIIEWKQIIRSLNNLAKNQLVSKAENEIIKDFLEFIDRNFPSLNPYDSFVDCKGDIELLNRRVKNLLEKLIAKDKSDVGYHSGWGCYYLNTPLPQLWMIGFKIDEYEKDWKLSINIYFGDTQSQARELYKEKIDYGKIVSLEKKGWECEPNFHICFMQKNLVWLNTPKESYASYLDYWNKNISEIKQHSKPELRTLLDKLLRNELIKINEEDKLEIKTHIEDTDRKKFYIAPGFGFIYSFNS